MSRAPANATPRAAHDPPARLSSACVSRVTIDAVTTVTTDTPVIVGYCRYTPQALVDARTKMNPENPPTAKLAPVLPTSGAFAVFMGASTNTRCDCCCLC